MNIPYRYHDPVTTTAVRSFRILHHCVANLLQVACDAGLAALLAPCPAIEFFVVDRMLSHLDEHDHEGTYGMATIAAGLRSPSSHNTVQTDLIILRHLWHPTDPRLEQVTPRALALISSSS